MIELILTCDNCGFIFSRSEETEQCPDCGKDNVRLANDAEQEEFAARTNSAAIRLMKSDDYPALSELWSQIPGLGLRTLDDSQEGITRFLMRNPATSFVAFDGPRLIGAILCGHDGRRGYIYHTVVLPEYRRRGIAASLLSNAVQSLRQERITRVCLNVMEQNEVGKQFWISKGWEKKDFLGFYSKAISEQKNDPLFDTAGRS